MFDLIDDVIDELDELVDDTLDAGQSLLNGEIMSESKVIKLFETGMTIYAISDMTGISVELIRKIVTED